MHTFFKVHSFSDNVTSKDFRVMCIVYKYVNVYAYTCCIQLCLYMN